MKSKIIAQNKNPFLRRDELTLEISSEISPSISGVVEQTKRDADLVVVKRINTSFGKRECTADILIYDSREALERVEVIPKKIRKKMEMEKKAAEESAAKKSEEEKEAREEVSGEDNKESIGEVSKGVKTKKPKSENSAE